MKGVVAYDTYFGNTKRVAEAIAEQIKADGHDVEIRNVREKYPTPPQGDFMFVGGPNRMKHLSRKTKKFVKKLDLAAWKGKPIVVFATVGKIPGENATEKEKVDAEKWVLAAAPELRDFARERGLNAAEQVLLVEVKDTKGPLVDDGIEHAKAFTHDVVQTLKK